MFNVKWGQWIQYLMLRLICAGLELPFLVLFRVEGDKGLWLARLEWGLDMDWEVGGWAGVSSEGELDGGGVHCHTAGSPPWASFSELKGALWDWSVRQTQDSQFKPCMIMHVCCVYVKINFVTMTCVTGLTALPNRIILDKKILLNLSFVLGDGYDNMPQKHLFKSPRFLPFGRCTGVDMHIFACTIWILLFLWGREFQCSAMTEEGTVWICQIFLKERLTLNSEQLKEYSRRTRLISNWPRRNNNRSCYHAHSQGQKPMDLVCKDADSS